VEVDEAVEHWTVLEDEQQLVAGKRGATRLGPARWKFYTRSRQRQVGGGALVRVCRKTRPGNCPVTGG